MASKSKPHSASKEASASNGKGKVHFGIDDPGSPRRASKKHVEVVVDDDELAAMRLKSVCRHITHVQSSCSLLGERLIAAGERQTGHKLIANGFIHDNSKFRGIEWLYLHDDVLETNPVMFTAAMIQHVHGNPHHPEYWDGIENMPRLYLAEFVCDTHARASEFGTNIRDWMKEDAAKKFGFAVQGKVYKNVKGLLDLLLDSPFK